MDKTWFLVACYATLHPALSVGWSVGLSVGWSVTFYFFYEFYFRTSLLLPKWSGDLKYGPCPPARDFGSRESGLVFFYLSLGCSTKVYLVPQDPFLWGSTVHAYEVSVLPYIHAGPITDSPGPRDNKQWGPHQRRSPEKHKDLHGFIFPPSQATLN